MFFKMLKSDLKRKKGLNLILFVFICVASVLVFAGSVQIFSNFTRERAAKELCRGSDTILWTLDHKGDSEEMRSKACELLDNDENVSEWSTSEMVLISDHTIDFPDYDEKENAYIFMSKIQCLTTQPREHDLVYDLKDEPFSVPGGCIAVPIDISMETGVKQGDMVRFTTDAGCTYELEVCRIFKESLSNGLRRFIVSDADYGVLTKDSVRKYNAYSVRLENASASKKDELESRLEESGVPTLVITHVDTLSVDIMMMRIISAFIIIISVFLIAIIFMTIRFTMVADLKSEEKEIGMMKALGVDSLSFRWLFAAKYIAFAVVGGIIGIAAGLPVAGMLVNMFGPDAILPERYEMVTIGVLSVVSIITMMIVFSLFVMRRINRISVIDAIHGENRGERFRKGSPMFLHRRKRMSIPLFLALTDILGRFKRYIFLIIAYSLGAAILLLVFNIRNSVINPHYARYWLNHHYDFAIHLNDELSDRISQVRKRTGKSYVEAVNDMLSEEGIPAHIDSMYEGTARLDREDGSQYYFSVLWKAGEPGQFEYRKGGTAPKLANEAAMSSYTATKLGIEPGDVIKVTITENNADHTGHTEVERELVVTALIDFMEFGDPSIIMGDEYEGAYKYGYRTTGRTIDAPEREKPAVIEQMRKFFGEDCVLDSVDAVRDDIGGFDKLFIELEFGIGGAVLLVLMLITYLYMSIFTAEEVPETALLKSMGFRSITIKNEYLLRITMLLLISLVLSELYIWTFGNYLFEWFMRQYEVAGMRFEFEFPVSFIVIPLIMLACFLLTSLFTLRSIDNVGIWKISEE
ncbi:MAG: ABC transporter permease [Ruminococcus sp.]|nr:ABC transporter permease [Ruminococcus sp.]